MRRLQRARVIVRRYESDDRRPDRDRKNKPLPHIFVSNAERRALLHGLKAPKQLTVICAMGTLTL
jgi:hypothetical protein